MVGHNPLWVAKQHGHRIATMLSAYAAWTEGAREEDIAAIRDAMNGDGPNPCSAPLIPPAVAFKAVPDVTRDTPGQRHHHWSRREHRPGRRHGARRRARRLICQ
jgi:hypothetical protein